MTYWEWLPFVQTRTDFVRFVGLLAVDAEMRADEWSSSSTAGFLDSLAQWTSVKADRSDSSGSVSWKELAQMLAAARVYEG